MSKRKSIDERADAESSGSPVRRRVEGDADVSDAAAAAAAAASPSVSASTSSLVDASSPPFDSASMAPPPDPYTLEVCRLRVRHQRRLATAALMARISTGGLATLATRVKAYQEAMKADTKRKESQFDINQQDDKGKTLLMHVIHLFGELCGQRRHSHPGDAVLSLSVLDVGGVAEHLDELMDQLDVTIRDQKGFNSLTCLANNIVVNAQCYTDWFVVTKLVHLYQARGMLDDRDPSGSTAFLHWCGSGCTYNVLQLLMQHGCDVDAVDAHGNSALHLLIQSRNFRALEALAMDECMFLCRPWWCIRNHAGLTVVQLSSAMQDTDASRQLHRLLTTAQADWQAGMEPLLLRQLEGSIPVRDCARIAMEYLDGSGKPFVSEAEQQAEEEKEQKQEGEAAATQGQAEAAAAPAVAAAAAPVAAAPAVNPAAADELVEEEEDDDDELDPSDDDLGEDEGVLDIEFVSD